MSEQPKIQVTKRVTASGDQGMVRLQAWVSAGTPEVPPELFVYQRIGTVPKADFPSDQFVHIASYADIVAFPVTEPDSYAPYFRKNGVDLIFPTRALLEKTWELCRAHLKLTIEDITRIDGLPPMEFEIVSL
jgi:hypothetical protein